MQYRRVVGVVAFAAALCCVAGHAGRRAVDRSDIVIALEVVPYFERAQQTGRSGDLMLMKEGLDRKLKRASVAMNPLFMSLHYCRARVTNYSPVPLLMYQVNSIIRHESGRQLVYRDAFVLQSDLRDIVTVQASGEAVVEVDMFGVNAEDDVIDVILPGRYEIRIVFRSADTGAEYTSSPVTITLSAEQILEFRREY